MKKLLGLFLLLSLTACSTVEYQPYQGTSGEVWEGLGGTKLVVDGIDFWDNGAPTHKYKLVGYATGVIGSGYGADKMFRSVVASQVKSLGASAAILVTGYTAAPGFVKAAPNMWMAANTRELKYAIVQYVE